MLYGGYVFEFCPTHRLRNLWGFVAQHRLVMEDTLGRPLRKGEVVHHRDENPLNNHPDNLEVMTKGDHHKHHMVKYWANRRSHLTDKSVRDALEGRSIKDAAKHLGVSHSTLRLHFPHLVNPRKRRSPTKLDDPVKIAMVLKYAPDRAVQLRDLVAMTGMSAMTILRICERNGVKWQKKTRKGEIRRTFRGKPTRRVLEAGGPPTAPVPPPPVRHARPAGELPFCEPPGVSD